MAGNAATVKVERRDAKEGFVSGSGFHFVKISPETRCCCLGAGSGMGQHP
jgi:hypothetical protein